ncbi:MAG: glutathione binding-like protein [Rhodovibrionaceae bacterium]
MTIDLYTWSTPNGRKASIMLEEVELPYSVHPIDITKDEQFAPDFLKISPNNKIPAIYDPDGPEGAAISIFETGAILIYLAEKTGKLLPEAPRHKYEVMQWLMWQMGGFGPMLGQAHHFLRFAKEDLPYAKDRYRNEARRLYGVLDTRLGESEFLGSGGYSIADIATYPWAMRHEWQEIDLGDFPNVSRWAETLAARPAVAKGMAVP